MIKPNWLGGVFECYLYVTHEVYRCPDFPETPFHYHASFTKIAEGIFRGFEAVDIT